MRLSKLWRDDRVLGAILLAALALGLIYNFTILPGLAPDEPRHFAYVRLLWQEHRFPFLLPDRSEYHGAHSLHPPLYYLILLPFYGLLQRLPDTAIYHGLRLISALICVLSLPLIYDVARRACGHSTENQTIENRNRGVWTARLTCVLVALTPIFGMTSGSVNNDSASVLAVALFLWLLSRQKAEITLRDAAWLGLVFGLGTLCKATVALCDGAALLVFLWARYGIHSPLFWRAFLISCLVAFAVMMPWYARNFALYGKFSPIESGFSSPALPNPSNGILVMMMHPNFPTLFGYANWGIFTSLWSQKDWIPQSVRTPIYLGFVALVVLSAVGNFKLRSAKSSDNLAIPANSNSDSRALRLALYAALGCNWVACAAMALFVHWGWAEGGRYLVAAFAALAFFVARGWNALVPPKLAFVALASLFLMLNGLCVFWLLSYLNPTFGPK